MTYDSTNCEDEAQVFFSKSAGTFRIRFEKKAKNAIYGGVNFSITPGIALKNFNKQSQKWKKSGQEQGIL